MWFDLLGFAVPLNLGVMEGSRIVALRAIGYNAVLGMTYGMAFRLAQLFWAGFGLVNYALMIPKGNRSVEAAIVRSQESGMAAPDPDTISHSRPAEGNGKPGHAVRNDSLEYSLPSDRSTPPGDDQTFRRLNPNPRDTGSGRDRR